MNPYDRSSVYFSGLIDGVQLVTGTQWSLNEIQKMAHTDGDIEGVFQFGLSDTGLPQVNLGTQSHTAISCLTSGCNKEDSWTHVAMTKIHQIHLLMLQWQCPSRNAPLMPR